MNSVSRISGGGKTRLYQYFEVFKEYIESILSWLNGQIVEQLNSSISVKLFNLTIIKLKNLFTTHYSQLTKRVFAFTLAETLIVMGVIGVVAALTLPNLNQSTNNKEKVTKVKKIYSNLDDAYGRAVAVYGPINEWKCTEGNAGKLADRFIEFMKLSKDCGNSPSTCFKNGSNGNDYRYIVLADGSSLKFDLDCSSGSFNYAIFNVDINGSNKGNSEQGRDLFDFYINDYSYSTPVLVPEGVDNTISCFSNHRLCTHWVIQNGNMDYLKANSNGKCNDSSVTLNETVTSCK